MLRHVAIVAAVWQLMLQLCGSSCGRKMVVTVVSCEGGNPIKLSNVSACNLIHFLLHFVSQHIFKIEIDRYCSY